MENSGDADRMKPAATRAAEPLDLEKQFEENEQQYPGGSPAEDLAHEPHGYRSFAISNDGNPYHAPSDGFQQSCPMPFDSSAALRKGPAKRSTQRSPVSNFENEYKQPGEADPHLGDEYEQQQNHPLSRHQQPACPLQSGPAGYFGILCARSVLSGDHSTNGGAGLYDYIALPMYKDQFYVEDATDKEEEEESRENLSPFLASRSASAAASTTSPPPPPSEIDFSDFSLFGKHLKSFNFPPLFTSYNPQTTDGQSIPKPPRSGPRYHYRFGLEEPPWQPALPPKRHRNDTTPWEAPVPENPPSFVFEPVRKLAFLLLRREHGQAGYFGARHDAALFERSFEMEMATTEGEDELSNLRAKEAGDDGVEDVAKGDTKDAAEPANSNENAVDVAVEQTGDGEAGDGETGGS